MIITDMEGCTSTSSKMLILKKGLLFKTNKTSHKLDNNYMYSKCSSPTIMSDTESQAACPCPLVNQGTLFWSNQHEHITDCITSMTGAAIIHNIVWTPWTGSCNHP